MILLFFEFHFKYIKKKFIYSIYAYDNGLLHNESEKVIVMAVYNRYMQKFSKKLTLNATISIVMILDVLLLL